MSGLEEGESSGVAYEAVDVLSKFATHIARRWRDPGGLDGLVDDELIGIEEKLSDFGERSRRELSDIPTLIRRDVGPIPLFEAAMLGHAASHIAGSNWGPQVPQDARYLFAGLSTRAVATLREIAILLDHGYALGAKSRWRTLSEILVVARVIARGDRFTATRYKEHRWIILAIDRAKTGQTDWSGDLPSPEVMRRRLIRRFGPEYARVYGWAARVTSRKLGVTRPGWQHLQELARVDEHIRRVQDAHHAVHGADAYGLLGTVDSGSGNFHAGASPQGVLSVASEAIRLFRQTMTAIFEICSEYTTVRKSQILWSTLEAHLFNLERDLAWRILSTDAAARERYLATMGDLLDENFDLLGLNDDPI